MTGNHGVPRRFRYVWLSAWPLWVLVVLAGLAAVRLLPGGYVRAALAAPILLLAPGSLTLSALVSHQHRPRGVVFVCYAALLGAVCSIFTSLVLYADGVSITAASTYWGLLALSTVLALVAEARLLLGRPGRGRRIAGQPDNTDPDLSGAEVHEAETPPVARREGYYAVLAVAAGATLLSGGLYSYDHLPHPAPAGYTWIAWTAPQIKGGTVVDSSGTKLGFEIVHRQSDTNGFRLSAIWLGTRSRPLAKPLAFSIGPGKTFRGAVFIPPLPDGCTYRIVVTLTATQQIDPMTKKLQTWSINADLHDPGKSLKTCQ